jgi:hypothetical protein
MNQEKKVVKISDIVQNQIPEFILSENPNFAEFFKQYYISQEFQGSNADLAENLIEYKNVDSFDNTNLISETTLTSSVEFFDDIINVSSTAGWPNQYGLLQIDNEIITYTGITTTSFTGCIRGFSGISSLTQENNPEFLVFSQTESAEHASQSAVHNLSNLFLKEFFRKVKYQFTPGFEELEFDSKINPQNFISKAKSFYETKGTDEAFKILFKVLYNNQVQILKPNDYTFTPSDDKWIITESFVCELITGNPLELKGQTLYQPDGTKGSIYAIEKFSINGNQFYKIKLFSGYSNNLNQKGSIEGAFVNTPNTYIVETIPQGSSIITVDSTVGFAQTGGTLEIGDLIIQYSEKTNNQFLGCLDKNLGTLGVGSSIARKTKVFSDHYVYGYESNTNNICKFKVLNVLSKLDSSNVLYAIDEDSIQIESFGSLEESQFSNSLIYNLPINISSGVGVANLTAEIRNNQKEGFSISNGSALTKYKHNLLNGDLVDLYFENTDDLISSDLPVSVTTEYDFSIPIQSVDNPEFLLGKNILFRRKIKKSPFKGFNLTANIQDSYVDDDFNYITSNGLPDYEVNPIDFKLNFAVDSTYILNTVDSTYNNLIAHSYVWGDALTVVSFNATSGYSAYSGIQTGNTYYVKTFNQTSIALCRTKDDLINGIFVPFLEFSNLTLISRLNTIILDSNSAYGYEYESSKLFKKFPKTPIRTKTKDITIPGGVGIFKNGIPIINYKSFDKVYYGPIESIDVINSGVDYNLYNPPQFKITYNGVEHSEIKILPRLTGKVINLKVNDPGYDYVETPIVKIIGGNNDSVSTEVKMKNINREVYFNSSTKSSEVDISNDIFLFTSPHRFVTGEPVVYNTLGTSSIGIGTISADGYLSNQSVYYVYNVGAGTSMRLAYTKTDAINGSNLINLRTKGGGYQKFVSTIPKKVVDEVNITKNDKEFEYKKLSFIHTDVNLQDNVITIENHGFKTGEAVVYTCEASPGYLVYSIVGLEINKKYYISKLDDNKVRLTNTPNGTDYLDLQGTSNTSIYFLEYPRVEVQILGTTTISGISTIGYNATIVPNISGNVIEAKVQKNPLFNDFNFGYSNIINYHKPPIITPIEGSGASFQALIVDGRINEVVVKNQGNNYYNSIELVVSGDGFGAVLNPIVVDGKITEVAIVNGGFGYSSNNTTIKIDVIGKNLKLSANIKSWTVNDVYKFNLVDTSTRGKIFGKQYSLRGKTFGLFYLNDDLRTYLNIPNTPGTHSPIVGWAYDGCPIYGPFAYQNTNGTGGIIRMRSGYILQAQTPGPFSFVEEYTFTNAGTLDEHNGRFCVTPEFPNGVYAYFCTFNESNVAEFPYVIGNTYNFKVETNNLDLTNNQNKDFNSLNIIKNTKPYRFQNTENTYEYFQYYPNKNKKDVIVTNSSSGSIDEIKVINGGINYQIGDSIQFDNEGTLGKGVIAKVSELEGVGISSISTQISTLNLNNVVFTYDGQSLVGIASTYHSLKNNSYINISGISSSLYNNINGFKNISVYFPQTNLSVALNNSSTTGILTSIQIKNSVFSYEIDSYLKISNEIVKIVGIDYKNNLISILRDASGTSHISGAVVSILPNKFYISSQNLCPSFSNVNDVYYFNPSESVVIGTDTTIGVGATLTINPLGEGSPYTKYVKTGGIYLPNNKFKTGDNITYSPGISSITTNLGYLDKISNLYVVKLEDDVVGLVTSKNNIVNYNNPIVFTSSGTGNLHKFKTNRDVITANVKSVSATVSTASTHGLSVNDTINLNVKSGLSTAYVVSYDGASNRLVIDSNINPFINLYRNDTVTFDLSSATLSDTDFNLYTDDDLQNKYFANEDNFVEVSKTTSELVLQITDKTPSVLYYGLTSPTKIIYTNDLIVDHNKLIISDSLYNGNSSISTCTANSFEIYLKSTPERLNYEDSSILSYKVINSSTIGPISKIGLISKGSEYKKLPDISSIQTNNGTGATLVPLSNSIGKILNTKVNNTKFICPTDKTLKPLSNVFSSVNISDNFTVKELNIIFGGKNYITPPKLKLYNQKNNTIVNNFSVFPILKNSSINSIQIGNPGYGLNSNDNQIVAEDNSNGLKIISVTTTITEPYAVTLTLQTPIAGFTTSNPLPIDIGDKIYVEGIESNFGSGFNSKNHGYQFFEVTYVDPSYGSQDAATVRYELNTYPGDYDEDNTYKAFVTPFSYLPQIEVVLDKNVFVSGEYANGTYIVDNINNDPIKNLVKLKDSENIQINDILNGSYSKSKGKIIEINSYNTEFKIDSSVSEIIGGKENKGYLSSNIQKLSDNDYYQKFSYSLKSKKDFTKWNSPISDLSHIAGYKKFSDLSIDSNVVELNPSITSVTYNKLNVILSSYGNVNSVHDFDLITEEDVDTNNNLYSQYLTFNSVKLANSFKSTNNRVLSIDDISKLFTEDIINPTILIDNINILSTNAVKYQFFLSQTSSFLGEFVYPEMFEVFITKNQGIYNLTSYSYFYDPSIYPNSIFGEFTVDQDPADSNLSLLNFTVKNPFVTVDIKAIKETVNVSVGVATTSFGYLKNVELTKEVPSSGITTTLYTIPSSDCQSGIIFIGISSEGKDLEQAYESSFVSNNGTVYINTYADSVTKDLGTFSIVDDGSNVNIQYTGISGIGVTVYCNFKLLTNTYAGYDSIQKSISLVSSSQALSSGSGSVAISTVSGNYSYTKYVIEVQKTSGISTQKSICQINSIHFKDYLNNIIYAEQGDLPVDQYSFDTVYDLISNTYTLYFTPTDSANYKLLVYESSLLYPN